MSSSNKPQSKHSGQVEDLDSDPHGEACQKEQSTQLVFHPFSAIFSLLEGAERDALEESIEKNGIREPLTRFEEMLLDGRNRYLVGLKLKLPSAKIPIREFDPTRD